MSKTTTNRHQSLADIAAELERSSGVSIDVRYDILADSFEVNLTKGGYGKVVRIAAWESNENIARNLQLAVADLFASANNGNAEPKVRIRELERELEKYKAAVKQLSFDLEMATSNKSYATNVETERVIRKFALEQAAEYLNDHGVIRTGVELEQVCEQIKKLHPTRDIKMGQAAAAMNAMFSTKKTGVPF